MRSPYRHSVWFDILGVVVFLALLLGPCAYLITEMTSRVQGGEAVVRGSGGGSAPRSHPVPSEPVASIPLSVSATDGQPAGRGPVSVPFSDQWRSQATPDLTGLDRSGGFAGGGAVVAAPGGGRSSALAMGPTGAVDGFSSPGSAGRSGPSVGGASVGMSPRGSGGGSGGGGPALATHGSGTPGGGSLGGAATASRSSASRASAGRSATRAEAERLSGKLRALSGQLRQMEQSASSSAKQTASGPSAPDDPDRRSTDPPSNVPIGDHLHWLAVAGLLWGCWRIGRGI